MKKNLALLGALVILGSLMYYCVYEHDIKVDALTFSNTATWDPYLYSQKTWYPAFLGTSTDSIFIPPPRKNSSSQTQSDLRELHIYMQNERTDEAVRIIKEEQEFSGILFDGMRHMEILETKPMTGRVLSSVLPEFTALTLRKKEQFDRVRPSVLDTGITTVIEVPRHPAYPSGHAGQSKLVALILSNLNPSRTVAYETDARRIAHNREIAGVHYPSDSHAGQLLAEKYFELLLEDERFIHMMNEARAEW